jgi:two-component sensor histidine kinase/HAMP domain-containing protein
MPGNLLNSIKVKLIMLLTLLVSVLAIFLAIYLPHKFEHERFAALEDKAKTICAIAGSTVVSSVLFNDPQSLKEDIAPISNNNDIAYIIIVNNNNKILYSYRYTKVILDSSFLIPYDIDIHNYPVIKVSNNITLNNNVIGRLFMGFSSAAIKDNMAQLKTEILVIIVFIFLMGIMASLFIGIFFTRPIKSIMQATSEVAKGNFEAKANIYGRDEVGVFAVRFNEMVLKLKTFYTELDGMVKDRTLQLQEINERLQNEIIERANAEIQIKASLEEKNVMLKEIHHRVKNNMQVISSLFYLQSRKVKDKEVAQLFTESQNRILSMSLVHENIYQNNDLGRVEFYQYIIKLLNNVRSSFKDESAGIAISTDIDNLKFTVDTAIPLGMIINELITNVFKHAFKPLPGKELTTDKRLLIRLKEDDIIKLEVIDNGCGIPEEVISKKTGTLGMELIKGLTRQIDGKLSIINDHGTKFIVELPNGKK